MGVELLILTKGGRNDCGELCVLLALLRVLHIASGYLYLNKFSSPWFGYLDTDDEWKRFVGGL
jgi:hypothetical protein